MINYLINNKIGEDKKENSMSRTYRNYPYNINLNEIFVGILVFIRNIIINFTLIIVLYYLS